MKISTLIIEDELSARNILKNLLQNFCPSIHIIGEAKNGEEGLQLITRLKPQLVFVDIDMPDKSGVELIDETRLIPFHTVYVTAHSRFAISAIKQEVTGYLLKPVNIKELIALVAKVEQKINAQIAHPFKNKKLALQHRKGTSYLDVNTIFFLQSDGAYTKVYANDDEFLASKNLGSFASDPVLSGFIRVNRSYLVNPNLIKEITTEGYLIIGDHPVIIGKNKVAELKKILKA